MAGGVDLQILLSTLSPILSDPEYVFLSFEGAVYGDHKELEPIASFAENEGLTFVVERVKAIEHCLTYESTFKHIRLEVHSSLDAVGLTAAFATKLTESNISANVIAGYYHDHIFVRSVDADKAVACLNELASEQQAR